MLHTTNLTATIDITINRTVADGDTRFLHHSLLASISITRTLAGSEHMTCGCSTLSTYRTTSDNNIADAAGITSKIVIIAFC